MTGAAIRQTFLDFYQARGHRILPSASLVPEDPTVLLTIAGMLQFKPVFLGQRERLVPRATTSQKCVRTNDIENVGVTARHHTFFEMLGNFSFGDYFKEQAIAWAWELSTQVFGLPADRLVPSVYEEDDEAFAIWRDQIGIPAHRIQRMGSEDNFWASGPTGPCGPCSEIYYDFHPEQGDQKLDLEDDRRFIEFYNLVFMQYNRDAEGNLTPLANQNIDTGLGLERMAQILQAVPNNYETDLIFPMIEAAANLAGLNYATAEDRTKTSLKVIGDHIRAVMHMIADGITASNMGRGYVLRRLIRRVVRHGQLLGISELFTPQVVEVAMQLAEPFYPEVRERDSVIKSELEREEIQFRKTLDRGEKLLAEIIAQGPKQISGQDAFTLYDTHGFPLELTEEIAAEQGLIVDRAGFDAAMEEQRQRAKDAHITIDLTAQADLDALLMDLPHTEFVGYGQPAQSAKILALWANDQLQEQAEAGDEVQVILDSTPFYAESGGQIGDRGFLLGDQWVIRVEDVQKQSDVFLHSGRVERGTVSLGDTLTAQIDRACRRRAQAHHTATHLLQAALKKLIDASISQAGSLVAFDRLRFDFNFTRSLTPEEIQQIEDQINLWISEGHPTQSEVMTLDAAKARGAIAMFGEKYGSQVRVVDVPGVSMELCGGTHVLNTAEIGLFKIVSETGVAAGIRRIEAIAGVAVLEYLNVRDAVVRDLSDRFKAKPEELPDRVAALQAELKTAQKQVDRLKAELALRQSDQLAQSAEAVGEFQVLVAQLEGVDPVALKTAAEKLTHQLGESAAVVLGSAPTPEKVSLVASFGPRVNQVGLQAGKLVGEVAKLCGGGGGGRPNFAQAGGRDPSQLTAALAQARAQLIQALGKE
ncbi:alanine--tRNA ligase [Lyngbya confervoides]|uniref:Alanine--tRNA ligase n=1 Tax=Lyngbya confervoides BDU141951 TaxID=1574623 RepID=A0ABD4T744_9CYAN|nr:alanine--tRNA ligase [Lyngbya confervoides]MCM1984543.1 alanine--tRNA ligase [Lyngbya confervoides BDU141951]